jgi:PAS domain S-box-containing protein
MRLPNWKFRNAEAGRASEASQTEATSWPDMFANLQSAYAELTNAQFELERRAVEISETRDLVQQIIFSMSEALFLTDRTGRVIRTNPAAAALLGCTEEEILNRPLAAVCDNDALPATPWSLMEMAQGGRTLNLDVDINTASGEPIPVNFSLTLMHDKQDKITGVLAVARDMREQRHLIESLVSARTRFQELLEFAPDAIVLANQDGVIVLVNSQTERLFGYHREALLGQSVEMLVPERYRNSGGAEGHTVPADVPLDNLYPELGQIQNSRNALILRNADEDAQQIEFWVVDAHGREFLTEITQRPIVTEDGLLLMSVIRDISDRKRIQQELHNSEARYRALAETAQDVIVTMDEERTITFINSAAERVFGYRPDELMGQPVRLLLPQTDAAEQPAGTGFLRQLGPLRQMSGQRKDGSEVLLELANSKFKQQGKVLYTAFIRDITDRKRMEEQLLESEERYRNVALTAAEAILTVDAADVIKFANPAVTRVFGYEAQELLGRHVSELMPNYDQHIHKPALEPGATERDYNWKGVELRGLHCAGHEIALEVSFNEFTRDGQKLRTGVIRDITERKQADEQLRINLRALEASAFPILIVDAQAPDMPLSYVNPAFERVTGYTAPEALGRNCRFLQGSDREQAALDELRAALREGRDCTVTLRNYRKDGTLFWNELTVSPVRDAQGRITHFVGFENDITERKRAEEALLEATAVQRAILDFASYAIFATAPDGAITLFNPAAERMLGYSAAEMVGQATALKLHDPQELAARAEELTTELGQLLGPGFEVLVAKARLNQPNEGEYTYLRKDGSRLPVNLSVSALRDAQGEITGFLGIASDITERKRAQERFARQTALRLALSHVLAAAEGALPQVLQRAMETLAESLDVSLARLWLLNESGETLDLQASAGPVDSDQEQQVRLGEGRVGQLASARTPQLANSQATLFDQGDRDIVLIELALDGPADSEEEWCEQEGLLGFAGYPLLAGDCLLGVLAVYARQPLNEDALNALGAASDILVLNLERKRAEAERACLQEREAARVQHQAALRVDVSSALNKLDTTLPQMLQSCVQAVVKHLEAACARIWLLDAAGDTLVLQAGAGLEPVSNGAQVLIPVGKAEIGLIAEECKSYFTNNLLNDERLCDKDWAARENLTAFAGYPLLAQGRLLGVLAMFAKQPLEQDTLNALAAVADLIVLGIERRKAEEARAALLTNEQKARRVAEEASHLKDDFLAMISHELRAPLTAILGWAQMLRSGTLDRASAERALLTIERNAKTQAHLVGDLLDASRIATGKLRLDKKPVELMPLIEAAIDAIRPSVEAKNLRLQIVMEPWVGPFEGDPERLRQIVWNLLSNAVKFTSPGGLIEIRLEKMEDKALLIVSDTGQGIEQEFLPYVFERFRQADSSAKRQHGGLGLGLAIVKSLVELHGGAIYAYSAGKGHGSDFMVTLPLAVRNATEAAKALWLPDGEMRGVRGAGSLRGVRVLVVDDERDTREILAVMLGRFGAEVRTAGSAVEGLATLKEWQPNLLVSDIGMPGEDGYVFLGRVRELAADAGGQIPAIALTAFASSQDRQRALEAGFQVHLAKPVEPVELARLVARTLGRSEAGIEL